jgi:hypothetical protein
MYELESGLAYICASLAEFVCNYLQGNTNAKKTISGMWTFVCLSKKLMYEKTGENKL